MPHRRDQIEALEVRASCWNLIIEILKQGHRLRLPRRRFGRDALMFLTYGQVTVSYSRGKLTRAIDVARHLECPPETARRHLRQLTELGLLEREKNTYRPSRKIGPIVRLNETIRAVQQAAVALGSYTDRAARPHSQN
jgi:DNA-binding MarR family transcriptional regulator